MIYPPVNELLKRVECRYTLVIQVSKRARQLVEGADRLSNCPSEKPVTIAVNEIFEGKVRGELIAPLSLQ